MAYQPQPIPVRDFAVPSSTFARTNERAFELLRHQSTGQIPAHPLDFQSLLNEVVGLAKMLTGGCGSAIALRGEQGTICRANSGEGAPPIGAPVDITSGISKRCLDSGVPLYSEDIAIDGRVDPETFHAIEVRAVAVVPIYTLGEVTGILAAFSRTPGFFTSQHLESLQQLADLIDPAAENIENEPRYTDQENGWSDVFVESHIPWKRFLQSVCLHVVVLGMLSGLSRVWPRERLVFSPPLQDAHITYYPFAQSYPARKSNPVVQPRWRHALARRTLSAGDRPQSVSSLDIRKRGAGERRPLSVPPPEMAVAAVNRWETLRLGAMRSVLPAPPISGLNKLGNKDRSGLVDLPQAGVLGPAPDLSGAPGVRRVNTPGASVVPPSPNVGTSMRTGVHSLGKLEDSSAGSGEPWIVPPPPIVNEHAALTYGAAGIPSSNGVQVVAPPPLIRGQGGLGTRGVAIGLAGSGLQVVSPPPSIQGNGHGGGGARMASLARGGVQVVAPPPSVPGQGGLGGVGRAVALGGGGSQVVPPPPSLPGGAGGISGGARGNGLATGGLQVVPPAPSVGGAGGGLAAGRGGSLARAEGGGALPPRSIPGGVAANAGGTIAPDAPHESLPQVSSNHPPPPSFQDAHVRVVSLAMALPNSSYFSNYEVFVAERWLSKRESQLIKLVYEFLPYQKRLSQYGDITKMFKVRVTRDPSCDESLMQIMWPEGEKAAPGAQRAGEAVAASPAERKNLLPCYRTTADEYRQSLSR